MTPYLRERVEAARRGLMGVHKALIDVERVRYERVHGRVDHAGALLTLVIDDPAFAWVRPLSSLIVRMDALLSGGGAAEAGEDSPEAAALIDQARQLLRPDAEGSEFARQYEQAMQASPDVVLAHGAALALLEPVH
jgi:hypothetical protein